MTISRALLFEVKYDNLTEHFPRNTGTSTLLTLIYKIEKHKPEIDNATSDSLLCKSTSRWEPKIQFADSTFECGSAN